MIEVVIHPFGEIDEQLVEGVRAAVQQRFGERVTVGRSLILPAQAYSHKRTQYRSTTLLDELSELGRQENQIRLGVAAVDLFAPDLNFVFGEASRVGGVALFSIARLDPCRYGETTNTPLLARRAAIEAIHEVGHVLGLGHCRRRNCVMWFSNMLAETDRKGSHFCRECAEHLGLPPHLEGDQFKKAG